MATKLTSGDIFPRLALNLAGGGTLSLPEDIQTQLTVVLFYRGHW